MTELITAATPTGRALDRQMRSVQRQWASVLQRTRARPRFEGWFIRITSASGETAAVIPGLYRGRSPDNDYGFIQVVDGKTNQAGCFKFPSWRFDDRGALRLGNSCFAPTQIELHPEDTQGIVSGMLRFENLRPWTGRAWPSPAMGWFSWLPGLQCHQAVISLRHGVEGSLQLNGRTVDFGGGIGYLEKTWGRSFPNAWLWGQCQHFDRGPLSLFFAIANVPLAGSPMRGVTAALMAEDRLWRWGSWRGERVQVQRASGTLKITLRGWTGRLEISVPGNLADEEDAERDVSSPNVSIPTEKGLELRVHERLDQPLEIRLFDRRRQLWAASGTLGAIDQVNVDSLITD